VDRKVDRDALLPRRDVSAAPVKELASGAAAQTILDLERQVCHHRCGLSTLSTRRGAAARESPAFGFA
jgi:hypothetical protein